jgi:hypothetical protein
VIEFSTEFVENLVATAVDMLSISVAYQLGINQSGFIIGFLYAVMDAYVVIWQRRRLTKLAHLVKARLSRLVGSIRQPETAIREGGGGSLSDQENSWDRGHSCGPSVD